MNAIILAAGMGTRLRPLTNDIPKCLVPVLGVPMVERQIQFLLDAGITDITLVSGYKGERLDYLKEKYGVSIVRNPKFDVCNNIYSIYSVKERLGDTYVIEGDVFMNANCFLLRPEVSTYYSVWKDDFVNEWGLTVDKDNRLQEIKVGRVKGFIMSGISYWTAEDSLKIIDRIEDIIAHEDYTNLFWDNAVIDIYQSLNIKVQRFDDIYEIDTELELRSLEAKLIAI